MNKILKGISLLFTMVMAGVGLSSCLDDETVTTSSQCVIASFSVADITTSFTEKLKNGEDTTFTRVIDGDDVYFNIDQVKNRITSVDSLPSWVDLSRVLPSVSYAGYIYCSQRGDANFYGFSSGVDSVDFTQPVRFMLVSTDGKDSRIYTAQIFQSKQDADSLYWTALTDTQMPAMGEHRLLTMGKKLYAFAGDETNCTAASAALSEDGLLTWNTIANLTGAIVPLSQTICTFKENFYALDKNGLLLRSADGMSWEQVNGSTSFKRLLCGDNHQLYAANDTAIMATSDVQIWENVGSMDLSLLPDAPVQSVMYATKTYSELENVVMLGTNSGMSNYAVAWFKISAADAELNQPWAYIHITDDNGYPLPALRGLRMVRYSGKLFAFGAPYDTFYQSDDNGITWQARTSEILPPMGLRGDATAQASIAVLGDYLWLTTGDGRVWRGNLRQ